jgi:Ni/Fe-hydrogenase subunit HybB-like protein
MSALLKPFKSDQPIPKSFYPLLAFTLLGIGLSIYRLYAGLGVTTNMSDRYPWGLWITIDLFLIPVAGAAFTISLISYYFGREHFHSVIRPAVVAGFLGYSIVGVLLFLDIGRWPQFYNIFVPPLNIHSFLEEISLCVTLYTIILVIEIAPIFLEKWGLTKPIAWIERWILWIAGAGIVLSTLHQSSLGSLFLLLRYKLHPLWWTPALPVLFFLQALYTGLGTTAVATNLIWRMLKIPLDRKLYRRIGQVMALVLSLYFAVKVGDWMGSGEFTTLLHPDPYVAIALLEVFLGLIIPLGILFSRLGSHSAGPFWAGVFALIGTFINRLVITWIGVAEPSPLPYMPSWVEVLITVGLFCGGFLIQGVIVRYFKLFPSQGESHSH